MSNEIPTGIERPIMQQVAATGGGVTLPSQSGHAGEVLSTDGSSLEWIAVSGTGTVTSVGLTVPSIFTDGGTPVTAAGNLSFTINSQSANLVFASPTTGSAAVPTFRSLVAADIPNLSALKITSGTLDTARLGSGTADNTKFLRGDSTWQTFTSGTVTSVGVALPDIFSVASSPVTSSGTITATLASQATNLVFASPNGSTGAPTFRALASADIPNLAFSKITGTVPLTQGGTGQTTANAALNALLPTQTGNSGKYLTTDGADASWATVSGGSGTVTSVAVSVPNIFSVSGSPVTSSGTIAITLASQGTGNQVFASPDGTSGTPGFRALLAADIPSLAASKITSGTFSAALLGSGTADNTKFLRGDSTWQTFTSGTLTSVALSMPSIFSVSGSPVSGTSGTFTVTLGSQTANYVFAAPNGSAGVPTFRAMVAADIPSLDAGKITTGTFTTSQIPSLDTSKITTGTFANSFLDTVGIAKGGTGQTTANAGLNALLPTQTGNSGKFLTTDGTNTSWATVGGSGTVTSVSVVSANGFAGTVATSTTTPAITLTTTITGLLKGNGTAISAASAGTDYLTVLSGDVTTSGNTATIPATTITNAKLADVATATFKGRTTAGTGSPEDLTVSQAKALLNLSGTNTGDQTITLSGGVTGSGTGTITATVVTNANLTGDVTSVGNATTISSGVVTNAMLAGSIDLTTKVVNALPIANGGTGQTTANAALNALLPTQTGNSGKSLQSDGTNTSWVTTGTVSSVAVSVPNIFSVSGSPVTSSGTIAITLASQGTGNQVFVSPDGTSGTPGFRALVAADIPSLAASKITSGTFSAALLGSGTADNTKFLRGDSTWQTFTSGTVTSVALSMPSIFSVSGSPITGSGGTFTVTLGSQTANYAFMTPDGSAGSPTFRALVAADIPDLAASKITTGTFTTSQIPSLDTSKITTGTFANSFLDTVGVAKGGTGATSLTAYGIVVGGTTSTGVVQSVAAGTAGQVLTSGGSSAIPAWVTAVPIANGGTGQTTAAAARNALLPSQTGNSGKYLTTDGTDASWATVSGGGTSLLLGTMARQIAESGSQNMKRCAALTSSRYIALVGYTNVTYYTGSAWSNVAHGAASNAASGLCANGDKVIVCGTGTTWRKSSNGGDTWSTITHGLTTGSYSCMARGGDNGASTVWVVGAVNSTTGLGGISTDNGDTWSNKAVSGTSQAIACILNDGGTSGSTEWLALVGATATRKSSDNAATWAAGSTLGATPTWGVYAASKFWAISTSGVLSYCSSVADAWTSLTAPLGNASLRAFGYANSKFCLLDSAGMFWQCTDPSSSNVWTVAGICTVSSSSVSNIHYFSGKYYIHTGDGSTYIQINTIA